MAIAQAGMSAECWPGCSDPVRIVYVIMADTSRTTVNDCQEANFSEAGYIPNVFVYDGINLWLGQELPGGLHHGATNGDPERQSEHLFHDYRTAVFSSSNRISGGG